MTSEPTVFVVDDDAAMRKSLCWLVESVGLKAEAYATPGQFLDAADFDGPGCLVLDVRMPGMNGIELHDRLAARGISIPAIIVTGYGDVSTAVRAMKSGVVDFIEKPFDDQALLDRIQNCIDRDAANRQKRGRSAGVLKRWTRLTPREREVMDLVVAGKSNKAAARQLGISPKTVEAHRAKVMQKMRAHSVVQLVQMANICEASKGKPQIC